ncbi:MAG: DNA cytosine methyltransferase [Prevotellaceae bacterium]|nr:DNA cytosine methyltransferase [Prevotellaceae bacterium]
MPSRANKLTFIDLFAGIGGIRLGFEMACRERGWDCQCVYTSEIKPYAVSVLRQNHSGEVVHGDITTIKETSIPDFDFLLAGFPCQAFSSAGKRLGFEDTRGTLFFEVARILRHKKPRGFILENVEGLVSHDKEQPTDKIGRTLRVILDTLSGLGYKVSWKVLNAKNFAVPQERKRIYITGTLDAAPCLDGFQPRHSKVADVIDKGLPTISSPFIDAVLRNYPAESLCGKSFKDKRGGGDNIHSWDVGLKGEVTEGERELLNVLLKERRKKKWAAEYGIDWMDGMPLTLAQIRTFHDRPDLQAMLSSLVRKGYLKREFPKRKVGNRRVQDDTLPLGYNIVTGKMSFEVNKVLDPEGIAPTLVAMDMQRIFVVDAGGLRNLTLREGLRLFGYPEDFKFDVERKYGYDLLGNTVVVPVIKAVAGRVLSAAVSTDQGRSYINPEGVAYGSRGLSVAIPTDQGVSLISAEGTAHTCHENALANGLYLRHNIVLSYDTGGVATLDPRLPSVAPSGLALNATD